MSSDSEPPPLTANIIDTREFFLPGSGVSALLVHGLTGTPYEMRYLGERLSAAGVRVFAVRLAGHGGTPEELGATSHHHWYESVVDGCERLRAYGDPIVVVGLSAGGVLAARLALDQGEVLSGVVMLAPAFFLPFWQRAALAAIKRMGPRAGMIYLRAMAGADIMTVHPEAGPHLHRTLQAIKHAGKRAGVALNPATPPDAIDFVLDQVDLILVMTVNPGFGGQSFLASQLDKIRALRKRIDYTGRVIDLEVDGGINPETARAAIAAGADVLVAGTATFSGGPPRYAENMRRLRAGK